MLKRGASRSILGCVSSANCARNKAPFFTDNSCRYVEIYFLNGIKFIEEPLSKIKIELGIVLFVGGLGVN